MTTIAMQRSRPQQLVAAVLVATLMLPTVPATAQGKAGSSGLFTVKVQAGSPEYPEEIKLKAKFAREALSFEGRDKEKRSVVLSIPPAAVTSVSSRYQRRFPVSSFFLRAHEHNQAMREDWCDSDGNNRGEELAATLALALVSMIFVTRDYNVTLAWQEAGQERSALVRVKKRDYDSFMAELEKATQKSWPNAQRQWLTFKQAPKQEKNRKILIRLDRNAHLSQMMLPPGDYYGVLLERSGTKGELYVFESEWAFHDAFVGVAPVEFAHQQASADAPKDGQESTGIPAAEVSFQELEGISAFSEIRTVEKVIKFTGGKAEGIRP